MLSGNREEKNGGDIESVWRGAAAVSLRTVAMFILVSLFWACWTKPGFLLAARNICLQPGAAQGLLTVMLWTGTIVMIGTVVVAAHKSNILRSSVSQPLSFQASFKLYTTVTGLVIAVAAPASHLVINPQLSHLIAEFRNRSSSTEDSEDQLRSYYEDLNSAAIQAGPLIRSFSSSQEEQREQAHGFYKVSRRADLYQDIELIPDIVTELDGSHFSVNRYGMRDRQSVTVQKPVDTIRIALTGSSIVMGYGVSDEEVFSRIFESQLNQQSAGLTQRYEVLNFGVGKHWAPHRLIRIQRLVLNFNPDAIYYFAHQDEFRELVGYTAQLIASRLPLPSGHLKRVLDNTDITPEMAPGAIHSRLLKLEAELLAAIYQTIVNECREQDTLPVWIYLPVPGDAVDIQASKLITIASNAGFIVCNLSDWAETRDGLFRSPEDHHPNAVGHQRIAAALIRMINERPETLPEDPTKP
jgi:hypothetical protein